MSCAIAGTATPDTINERTNGRNMVMSSLYRRNCRVSDKTPRSKPTPTLSKSQLETAEGPPIARRPAATVGLAEPPRFTRSWLRAGRPKATRRARRRSSGGVGIGSHRNAGADRDRADVDVTVNRRASIPLGDLRIGGG